SGPERWSPSVSYWRMCGARATGEASGPSTSTCPGCGASSVRRQRIRVTCTVSAAWVFGSRPLTTGWTGIDAQTDLSARGGHDVRGHPRFLDPYGNAGAYP